MADDEYKLVADHYQDRLHHLREAPSLILEIAHMLVRTMGSIKKHPRIAAAYLFVSSLFFVQIFGHQPFFIAYSKSMVLSILAGSAIGMVIMQRYLFWACRAKLAVHYNNRMDILASEGKITGWVEPWYFVPLSNLIAGMIVLIPYVFLGALYLSYRLLSR
jgi:hypothetical protein